MDDSLIYDYFDGLARSINETVCTLSDGREASRAIAFENVIMLMRTAADSQEKVLFCGNGGSAGICSHMATDFSKNGCVPALALNDSSALTCLANDYGYEHVFSKQIEYLARTGDVVIAISSSGKSKNILNGVDAARAAGCHVITFSGFASDNPLRQMGDINFWVQAEEYGFVETAHLALISAILDLHMGWPNIKYP